MKITRLLNAMTCLLVIIALNSTQFAFAQKSETLTIEWEEPEVLKEGDRTITVPKIKGQKLDANRPNFFWREPMPSGINSQLTLEITGTQPAKSVEVAYLNSQNIEVGEANYLLSASRSNTEKHAVLNLFPFIKVGPTIHRITDVKVNFSKGTPDIQFIQKDFVANSALAPGSGSWYQITVTEDGIYHIDKAFLRQCFAGQGVDVENLNPDHINIYGNGEGRLPEANWVYRTDDLAKNSIQIVGGQDGSFDDGDYILFYGWGPHRNYAIGTAELYNDRNPYSDISSYFININPNGTPKRVQNLSSSTSTVTHNVNTYSFFSIVENDLTSLVKGGQRWYGNKFETGDLVKNFTFTVPNVDASSIASYKVSLASNANSSSSNTHSYAINGSTVSTNNLPSTSTDYARSSIAFNYTNPVPSMTLTMTVNHSSPAIQTYLDFISLNVRRNLAMLGNQFNFRDLNSVGAGNVADYTLSGMLSSGFIWDVTHRQEPRLVQGSFIGSNYNFRATADTIREYVACNGAGYLTPTAVRPVVHQNLHGLGQADYLIVTDPEFIAGANRLADLHRANGLIVHVVTDEQIFNEFSSGAQDATAIRMFAKMFYDRGAGAPETRPKYLCLFGDGTYDPKNRVPNNNNYILTYQAANSENHIAALVTDDYYGLLDDAESISPNDEMDIGVGRLLISSTQIATEQVNKIEHYMRNGSAFYSTATTNCSSDNGSVTFGDWRTKYVQIADDEEGGYFINTDCEPAYDYLIDSFPAMNTDKVYLDAYQQVTTAGGERYPDVVNVINDRMERGALVINYVGHGGEVGVAEERVITVPQIQSWKNIDKLTLMVSATCEFTKYDDPDRTSAGEWASLNPFGGAIALMTTTRSVFFGVNSLTIRRFIENVFKRDASYEPMAFGEIMRRTKNTSGGSTNKRSFTLIGDPALKIALPRMNIVTDSINGLSPTIIMDTVGALGKVTIKGHLEDFDGNVLTGFNGVVYPSVLDKAKVQQTLGNDATSPVVDFELQNNLVYRGKASVVNGYFEFTFVVPKDINYSYGRGKISYYAENGSFDAIGSDNRVFIGGIDPNGINDSEGPQIEMFLNEDTFVNGGISDETPILIAKLFDENGINTVGNGIGHDLIAVLDGNSGNPIVLNDYYSADLDSYQRGEIRYNFSDLAPGPHTLSLKVWDVNNNSSEATLDFIVQVKEDLKLDHVLNYPNPFTTYTEFFFEHNQACVDLQAQIQIFTVSGRLVKTINQSVQCDGFRSKGIAWTGRDDFGDQLAKGVYVYQLTVRTPDGKTASKTEKLVLLK